MLSSIEKIAGLRLIKKIAAGGMGEIWMAKRERDEGFEKDFAVKMILPHLTENSEFVQMFLDEGRLVGNLDHPNICQITDMNQSNGIYYMIMEYIDGIVLTDVIDKIARKATFVPFEHCCEIIRAVCAGLEHAHSAVDRHGSSLNIIHRDISPPNIMIRRDGFVKIIDFGVAKAAIRLQRTQPGLLKGKIGYMSPEQVLGEELDHRSDIFALGVVLWEMSTSRRLFWGDNEMTVLKKIREGNYPLPSHFRENYPPALEWIIMKALTYHREERFQTCAEMEMELRNLANKEGYYSGQRQLSDFVRSLDDIEIPTSSKETPPSGLTKTQQSDLTFIPKEQTPEKLLHSFEFTPPAQGQRIIIVDDDPYVQDIVSIILMDEGYEVLHAYDGVEAVEKIRETLFDACLLDLDMPRKDGRSTLVDIKRIRPSLPCIIQTANEDFSLATEMGRLGAVTYLLKPVRKKVLEETVTQALNSRPTVHEWERLVNNDYPTFLAQLQSRYHALSHTDSSAKVRHSMLATQYEYIMAWLGSLAAAAYLHEDAFDEEVNAILLHFIDEFNTRTWYAWIHFVGEAYRRQGKALFSRTLQNLTVEVPEPETTDYTILQELIEKISSLSGKWSDNSPPSYQNAFMLLNEYIENHWRRDDLRSEREINKLVEVIANFLELLLKKVHRLIDYQLARVNGMTASGDSTQHQLMLLRGTNPTAGNYTSQPTESLQLLQVYLFDMVGKPMFPMDPFVIASTATEEESKHLGLAFPTQFSSSRDPLYRCTTSGQLCKPRKHGYHPGQLLRARLQHKSSANK